jgi:hypothetical protein
MIPGRETERRGNFQPWLVLKGLPNLPAVIAFLRVAGLIIAALWLGGTAFFVATLDPLFGQAGFIRLLGPLHANEVACLAADRFHLFQVCCAIAALLHALADWLYTGRPLERRFALLLVIVLALGTLGSLWLVPKCRELGTQAYLGPQRQVQGRALTPVQRQAAHALVLWNRVGLIFNGVSVLGVLGCFLLVATPPNGGPRGFGKGRLRI